MTEMKKIIARRNYNELLHSKHGLEGSVKGQKSSTDFSVS
jgi:hypothetical protein